MQIFKLSFFAFLLISFQTTFAAESAANEQEKFTCDVSEVCDTIYFRNGSTAYVTGMEITEYEVKFMLCDNLYGSPRTVRKSQILKIVRANGEVVFVEGEPPKYDILSIIGFISGISGLLVYALPLGLVSAVLGGIGLGNIEKTQKHGKKIARWAILIGLIDIFFGMISIFYFS